MNHSSNSKIAFTKNFTASRKCFCKCYCWVWRMIDSLYYSSQKIPERYENSFTDYRINYQKLCYLMRQITKNLNSVILCIVFAFVWHYGLHIVFLSAILFVKHLDKFLFWCKSYLLSLCDFFDLSCFVCLDLCSDYIWYMPLKRYYTPNLKLACFVCYLNIINHFVWKIMSAS